MPFINVSCDVHLGPATTGQLENIAGDGNTHHLTAHLFTALQQFPAESLQYMIVQYYKNKQLYCSIHLSLARELFATYHCYACLLLLSSGLILCLPLSVRSLGHMELNPSPPPPPLSPPILTLSGATTLILKVVIYGQQEGTFCTLRVDVCHVAGDAGPTALQIVSIKICMK